MAAISGSVATVPANTAGSWWSPATATIAVDIDNAADVIIESRRDSGDAAAKPVFLGDQHTTILRGPCSAILQVVVGRNYRFRAMAVAASCGAYD